MKNKTNMFLVLHTQDGRGFTYTFERSTSGQTKIWLPLKFPLPSPRTTIVGTRGTNWAYVNSLSIGGLQKIFCHGHALPLGALTGLCLQGSSGDPVEIKLQTGSEFPDDSQPKEALIKQAPLVDNPLSWLTTASGRTRHDTPNHSNIPKPK